MDDDSALGKRKHDGQTEASSSSHQHAVDVSSGGGADGGVPAQRHKGGDSEVSSVKAKIEKWEALVFKFAEEGNQVRACGAEVKQHDAEVRLACLQGDKMAQSKAEMDKSKAEMKAAEEKMKAAEEKMKAAAEGSEAHTLALEERQRAKEERERASKEYDKAEALQELALTEMKQLFASLENRRLSGDSGSSSGSKKQGKTSSPRIQQFVQNIKSFSQQRMPLEDGSTVPVLSGGEWMIPLGGDRFFIRECFVSLLEKVKDPHGAWSSPHTKNVLLRGTPGTGKSCFLQYLAWDILSKPRDFKVVLDIGLEVACVNSDNTVIAGRPSEGVASFNEALNESKTVLLFDCGAAKRQPPNDVRAKVFAASSPNQERYKEYKNKNCKKIMMPLWSEVELESCRQACFPRVSHDNFLERYSWWGGVVRNTIGDGSDDAVHECQDALRNLDLTSILNALGEIAGMDPDTGGGRVKHSIMHLDVTHDFTDWQFCFASQRVCDAILDRKADRAEQACREFLASHTDSVYSALRGQIFESFAHRSLAKGGQFSLRNLKDNSTENFHHPPRPLTRFDNLKEAVASTSFKDAYWVPNAKNFPVIDALMGDDGFQMTVSTDHGCVSSQMEKIKKDWPGFQRIVFVVPTDMAATYPQQKFTTQGGKECKTPPLSIRDIPQFVLGLDLSSTT